MLLDMLVKVLQCPKFLGIAKIRRALAGDINDPGNSIVSDLNTSACTLVIKQGSLDAALFIPVSSTAHPNGHFTSTNSILKFSSFPAIS